MKRLKFKKFVLCVFVCLLTVAMCVPALAAENDDETAEIVPQSREDTYEGNTVNDNESSLERLNTELNIINNTDDSKEENVQNNNVVKINENIADDENDEIAEKTDITYGGYDIIIDFDKIIIINGKDERNTINNAKYKEDVYTTICKNKGHEWNTEYEIIKKAEGDDFGIEVQLCAVCGAINEDTPTFYYEDGWHEIDGIYYFFKDSKIQKGWISYNGKKYYADSETGAMEKGLSKIDGKWYYFDPSDGKMLTGLQKINGYWRYFDTSNGSMLTAWQKINGFTRYFNTSNGRMVTGLQKIDGKWYYFDLSNGRMLTGWQKVNGYKRYFNPSNGIMLTGLQKINGKQYYFNMSNGRMLTGLQKINNKWYYFNPSDGKMLTGLQKINGYWRYFDMSNGSMLTAWQKVNGFTRYFNTSNGRMYKGLQKIDGKWYYFDLSNGRALTGWQKINGYWRYFDSSSCKMLTGWQKIDGESVHFDNGGRCLNLNQKSGKYKMKVYAQNYYSDTQWLMMVDLTNNITGVYKGSKGSWKQIYSWQCSTGTVEEPTPDGEFKINSNRGYCFGSDHYTCYYYSSFYGPYLFHSGLYYANTFEPQDIRLGIRASAGCIRLDINNAKWVLDNIPLDTKVVTYY